MALAGSCLVSVIAAAPGAAANEQALTIEPSTRVKGMLVVQGTVSHAQARLLGVSCDPVVLTPGRRTRKCTRIPNRVSRLYVGYGLFDSEAKIDRVWKAASWEMWIDGQRVNLEEFGASDRMLLRYPPAGNKDVVLREWNVTLTQLTPGRHTVRYRSREPIGITDTTWIFTVPPV